MSWSKLLQPDLILGGPILDLTPDILQQHQLRGLVLDVDETLVPLSAADASPELHDWVNQMRPLVKLWLVSNNLSERRIGRIADSLDLPYIAGARKPGRGKLWRAITGMKIPARHVAMVGDRLFTDVLAGNRLGMFTILVEPMVEPGKLQPLPQLRNLEMWVSQVLGASLPPKHRAP